MGHPKQNIQDTNLNDHEQPFYDLFSYQYVFETVKSVSSLKIVWLAKKVKKKPFVSRKLLKACDQTLERGSHLFNTLKSVCIS